MPRNNYHDTPVVEFHEAFGAPVAWRPGFPPDARILLRLELIFEEFKELLEETGFALFFEDRQVTGGLALAQLISRPPNLVGAADALTDLRYVIDGACLEFGLPAEKLLREVHRSNMSKLGADGKPILREDGKVLKGPGYQPPRLDLIIELYKETPNHG